MSVKTGGKKKYTETGKAVYANKRHINGQTERAEHRIEVRESLARGYIRWAEVNLELAQYCLCAENDLPVLTKGTTESDKDCQNAEKYITPT
ncbi:MAG TPA: hypothetical protein H9664_06225 [Firmicutes bacterium]|nr:hypothetical protein [Bacillota bacterium]